MTIEITVLKRRVVTASLLAGVLAAFLLAAAYSCSGRLALSLLAFLLTTLCAYEFTDFSISRPELAPGRQLLAKLPYFSAVVLPAAMAIAFIFKRESCSALCGANLLGASAAGLSISLAILFYALLLCGRRSLEACSTLMRELPLAVLLIGFGGAALQGLAWLEQGISPIIWLVFVVCSNDIAAYFGGSSIGGPKLAPALSPSKTLSGSLAGLLVGVVIGVLGRALIDIELEPLPAAALALVLVLVAQTGDLAKSYLKRLHEVKDSGTLLPGHGGVLDRLDAMLASAPFFYVWLSFFAR